MLVCERKKERKKEREREWSECNWESVSVVGVCIVMREGERESNRKSINVRVFVRGIIKKCAWEREGMRKKYNNWESVSVCMRERGREREQYKKYECLGVYVRS